MYLNKNGELFALLLLVKLVNGVKVMTTFQKLEGVGGDNDLKCAANATDKEYLATMIEASNTCASLDWSWASNPTYETGATYYKKKQVVEIYQPPMPQREPMVLPIALVTGSYIDFYITPDRMLTSSIVLTDTLDLSVVGRKYMIAMTIIPSSQTVRFKTYSHVSWTSRAVITPYPFQANKIHKLTFKAIEDVIQILLDDTVLVQYPHVTPPQNARMLVFSTNGAIMLHKIDFVGM